MTSFLTFALLLAGAAGDGAGLSFQAQVGYEPALLLTGYDYTYFSDGLFPTFQEATYFSHSLSGKIGIGTENDWQMRATGSVSQAVISGEPNIRYTETIWIPVETRWQSQEFSSGVEVEQGQMFLREKVGILLGLEFTWGKLFGDARFYRGAGDDREWRTEHLTSRMFGVQGHIGINIPIVAFGDFTLGINPNLKGGAVKEQSIKLLDTPSGTEWKGPRTLPRWGVALGLTLDYNGGKQQ